MSTIRAAASLPRMRIVVAPDSFGGTLSAREAAEAIAAGWRRGVPGADVAIVPLADGGTGFAEVLHTALGGTVHELEVTERTVRIESVVMERLVTFLNCHDVDKDAKRQFELHKILRAELLSLEVSSAS